MVEDIVLSPAEESMRAAAERLLATFGLATLDEASQFPEQYVAALIDGELVGLAGCELHGADALLRSVAVESEFRSRGLGVALTEEALAQAREGGAKRAWLLTTTAPDFFARLGFVPSDRGGAPAAIAATVEWSAACPASAVAMCLDFGEPAQA
ncbi:MAG: arsenic resistance N-acetyltransferase ArsN2 [Bryobacteraceae bacterium]